MFIGIIGAGQFTSTTLLPLLKSANIKYLASAGGLSAANLARKYKIACSTSDYRAILNDKAVDLVMVTTRHHNHFQLLIDALAAGKHVFVEKPLVLFESELAQVIEAERNQPGCCITVGFNRRFSPHARKVKSLLGNDPMNVIATINAGYIPCDSWVHDRAIGGGRIIGEACHFIDLISFFTGSVIREVCMNAMGINPSESTDNASIMLRYENGSTGVINYFSNGSKAYPKERLEVYSLGRTLIINDFKTLTGFGCNHFSKLATSQDKGHKEQFRLLLQSLKEGGNPLIPFHQIVNTTEATFAALKSLKTSGWVPCKTLIREEKNEV